MERYGRRSDGPQPDPSQEWTAPGTETGLEGKPEPLAFFKKKRIFETCRFIRNPSAFQVFVVFLIVYIWCVVVNE